MVERERERASERAQRSLTLASTFGTLSGLGGIFGLAGLPFAFMGAFRPIITEIDS